MKVVFLHGLGQTARDWQTVVRHTSLSDADCPELFSLVDGEVTYSHMLSGLEKRYEETAEPFALCGLSLGALLALDYTIRHQDKVSSLVLIGAQYQVPTLLIDVQNLMFRLMPAKSFDRMGVSKDQMIQLSRSMRSLDLSRRLCEISCPVTILCGEKDHANLKASRRLKALLPQSELHIIPGAGHELNQSAPEAISAVLNGLL
ncbi:MAG: alpha/beta fold hydrolase [Eubacteriales bacterium]|nr:alpha/beta fold hydrolase [Eubacteriales bacterium]